VTACSKLQYLSLAHCALPAGVWQHMFPGDTKLQQLRSLDLQRVQKPGGYSADNYAPCPVGNLLVSCCPGLQKLNIDQLWYSGELLAPLQGLSALEKLNLGTRFVCSGSGCGVSSYGAGGSEGVLL
jgi:hypothetical protein